MTHAVASLARLALPVAGCLAALNLGACSGASPGDTMPGAGGGSSSGAAGGSSGGGSGSGSGGGSGSSGGSSGGSGSSSGGAPACHETGFVPSASDVTLPAAGSVAAGYKPFGAIGGTGWLSSNDSVAFDTLDVDGDRIPDVVVTSTTGDAAVGVSKWIVYKGDGKGFAGPTDFALPSLGKVTSGDRPFGAMSGTGWISSTESASFVTTDVTGDGVPDLVVTALTGDAQLGVSSWRVYPGGAKGFASTAKDFALPSLGKVTSGDRPFGAMGGTGWLSSAESVAFETVDVTGDGLPDLVVTGLTGDASLGVSSWRVYQGGPSGFAATGAAFSLPSLGKVTSGDRPFGALSGTGWISSSESVVFSTVDVTGDHVPDLVVTSMTSDGLLGVTGWRVFAGGKGGFASTGADFALPSMGKVTSGDRPFGAMAGTGWITSTESVAFTTLDVTGDHLPDLVVTSSTSDAAVGVSKWLVFAGGAKGFAASSADFSLPSVGKTASGDKPFGALDGTGWVTSMDSLAHDVIDLDGDGALDLVVTSETTTPAAGASKWIVFRGACK